MKSKCKKPKDPNAPKRYRSAYILFTIAKRSQIKNENPGLPPKGIISELGALWKSADLQTKQYFQKLSDAEKAEYQTKCGVYKSLKMNNKNSLDMNTSTNEDPHQFPEPNTL